MESEIHRLGLCVQTRVPEKSLIETSDLWIFFGTLVCGGFVDRVEVRTLEHSWRFSELGL